MASIPIEQLDLETARKLGIEEEFLAYKNRGKRPEITQDEPDTAAEDEVESEPEAEEDTPETAPRYERPSFAERAGEVSGRLAGGALYRLGSAIGSESDTTEANGDDLSDLFAAPSSDDPDMRTDDLTSVSEEDVFGEGGEDMSDILEVTEEDLMGDDDIEDLFEAPAMPYVSSRRATPRRVTIPVGLGRVNY